MGVAMPGNPAPCIRGESTVWLATIDLFLWHPVVTTIPQDRTWDTTGYYSIPPNWQNSNDYTTLSTHYQPISDNTAYTFTYPSPCDTDNTLQILSEYDTNYTYQSFTQYDTDYIPWPIQRRFCLLLCHSDPCHVTNRHSQTSHLLWNWVNRYEIDSWQILVGLV